MIDIIIFTLLHSHAPFSSTTLSLAKEWAKHGRVFYIDHPLTIKDFIAQRHDHKLKQQNKDLLRGKNSYSQLPHTNSNLTVVTPRLTLPINALPEGKIYEGLARVNDYLLYKSIQQLCNDYNIKKYLFINAFDPFYTRYFPKSFKPLLYIYQSVDDISQESYIARHGIRLENEIISQHANLTLTTSQALLKCKLHYSPHTYLLPNAADVNLFKQALEKPLPKPQELKNINNKIIIYIGAISQLRFDYNLLHYIAKQHRDKSIVLLGPYHIDEIKQFQLDELPNVILTGPKPIEQLPAYLQHADCAIIPFLMNQLTKSIYPLKINEYLAAGKPVVTSPFSADIVDFGNNIYITNSPVQFSDYIDQAIQNDSPLAQAERLNLAQNNSWAKRTKQFWEIIQPYLAQKGHYLPNNSTKITLD